MALLDGADDELKWFIFPCELRQWPAIRSVLEDMISVVTPAELARHFHMLDYLIKMKEEDYLPGVRRIPDHVISDEHCLARFLSDAASEEEKENFFDVILPRIVDQALKIEDEKPHKGLKISRQQQGGTSVLSRQLVASILACAFLNLFPTRDQNDPLLNHSNFHLFFSYLDNSWQGTKLRCILHYFQRLNDNPDEFTGNITFTRKSIPYQRLFTLEDWLHCEQPLCPIFINNTGVIEDAGPQVVQVHFSDKKIGSGVLGNGKSQEEKTLVTSPELISCQMFMEAMDDNEAVWVQGHEKISKVKGSGVSIQYDSDYKDQAKRTKEGDLESTLCAMDAVNVISIGGERQYKEDCIVRELNKAFVGFCSLEMCEAMAGQTPSKEPSLEEEFFSALESLEEEDFVEREKTLDEYIQGLCNTILTSAIKESIDFELSRSDSHHDNSFNSDNQSEVDKSWLMSTRRRSSNLSDAASRRSSCSTKYSSDISSDFEELYDSFQKHERKLKQPVIKEETCNPAIQDFAASLVNSSFSEASVITSQMMPKVHQFSDRQPSHVTKPQPRRVSHDPPPVSNGHTAKENIHNHIAEYVEKLLTSSFNPVDISNTNGESPTPMTGIEQNENLSSTYAQAPPNGPSSIQDKKEESNRKTKYEQTLYRGAASERLRHTQCSGDHSLFTKNRKLKTPEKQMDAETMKTVAEDVVKTAVKSAIWEITQDKVEKEGKRRGSKGDAVWNDSEYFTREFCHLSSRRKSSCVSDSDLSAFAADLFRRGSFDEVRYRLHQRTHSGFRDTVLSSFADQLNHSSAKSLYFNMTYGKGRRCSDGPILPELPRRDSLGLFTSSRRGSADTSKKSKQNISRGSSEELLFEKILNDSDNSSRENSLNESVSHEAILEIFRRHRTSSQTSQGSSVDRRQSTSTPIDWFVQDILVNAFSDAFLELFGAEYIDSVVIKEPTENRTTPCLMTYTNKLNSDIYNTAISEISYKFNSNQGTREESLPREYADAMDIPYSVLETFADKQATTVLSEVLKEIKNYISLSSPANGAKRHKDSQNPRVRPVATGNWGCGSLGGDAQLKSLLQWASASKAGVPYVMYYTMDDPRVVELEGICELIQMNDWNVSDLMTQILSFCSHLEDIAGSDNVPLAGPTLFDALKSHFGAPP